MTTDDSERLHFRAALTLISHEPGPLREAVSVSGAFNRNSTLTAENIMDRIIGDPLAGPGRAFQVQLITWDHADPQEPGNTWTGDTRRNSPERRNLILEQLDLKEEADRINGAFPPALNHEVVIADKHEPWYPEDVNPFYWQRYAAYLGDKRGFHPESLATLDRVTTSVVSRICAPQRPEAFQAKGLVVGYVQSGKTSNFTGVIAKAIDSGYRLIIILSGTQNMLRNQTQRRIDMELVGKEGIRPTGAGPQDHDYGGDPDWEEMFIEYGGIPRALGGTNINRLTTEGRDFKHLEVGVADILNPDMERQRQDEPLHHIENLRRSNARLVVTKKNKSRLDQLIKNLRGLPPEVLDQIPALIIDDESDQASINTIKPKPRYLKDERKRRTAINERIGQILGILPRAQYLGYTATPAANVFVDPDDVEDIFPKDFVISLPRPPGYMGASDFHDGLTDPNPEHQKTNEEAHVRSIWSDRENDDADLQQAVDMFLLTGAVKLFREAHGEPGDWRHHTMLCHESVRMVDHEALADRIRELWSGGGYNGGTGLDRLKALFASDLIPVSDDRSDGVATPRRFDDLLPYLGEAHRNIDGAGVHSSQAVLVVNSDRDSSSLDFDSTPVWKIIVGGSKLSRGFTIEGLTISWFRRRSGYEDTIMQMGRWFGFRPGYRDLVRLYIARREPRGRKSPLDLYKAFEAICRDEEALRVELRRYEEEGVTPRQIPPLIQASHPDLLPVARNKMWNAILRAQNFGGEWTMKTLISFESEDIVHNTGLINDLLSGVDSTDLSVEVSRAGRRSTFSAKTWVVGPDPFIEMLGGYRWAKPHGNGLCASQLEFLQRPHHDQEMNAQVTDWLVVAPMLQRAENGHQSVGGEQITVVLRQLVGDNNRVDALGDPLVRSVSNLIIGADHGFDREPNLPDGLVKAHRGVICLYVVKPRGEDVDGTFQIGLEFLMPFNSFEKKLLWGVRQAGDAIAV
jgi:hypothetical protein